MTASSSSRSPFRGCFLGGGLSGLYVTVGEEYHCVLIEDLFVRERPRSKLPYGKDTVGVYSVRVTLLIRKSETC